MKSGREAGSGRRKGREGGGEGEKEREQGGWLFPCIMYSAKWKFMGYFFRKSSSPMLKTEPHVAQVSFRLHMRPG